MAGARSLFADTIFDNSVHDLATRFNPGTLEIGDEIVLAGTARYVTNFSFEFWGTNSAKPGNYSFSGQVQGRVRFYLNNGAPYSGYATPGTVLYDSGWFAVPSPTARSRFIFAAGSEFPSEGLFLPAAGLTWSVQFQGMAASDSVGVDLFSPPVVGTSYRDYWQKDSTGWSLRTFGSVSSTDFAAKIEAAAIALPAPPVLQIHWYPPKAVLTWPAQASNYLLETSSRLGPQAAWSPLSNGVVKSGNNFVFTNSFFDVAAFYRLHQRP